LVGIIEIKSKKLEYEEFKLFSVLVLLLIFTPTICLSQEEGKSQDHSNHIYLELLGSGGLYSINYEKVIKNKFTIRGGLSLVPRLDLGGVGTIEPGFTIPVSGSSLVHVSQSSYLEIGISTTYFYLDKTSFTTLGSIIGFRDQEFSKSNTVIRVFILPQFSFETNISFFVSGGISFGFSK